MAAVSRLKRSPEGVLGAVSSSLQAMTWLTPADDGLVALALEYAKQIDAADDPKIARWVGPQLFAVMKSLGGAPAERKALAVEENVRGKLAELRASPK